MSSTARSCAAMVIPFEKWPRVDRELWRANTLASDDLDAPAYAVNLSPKTIDNARKGWGRRLAVLHDNELLNPDVHPADRVTPAAMNLFVQALREAGNRGTSISVRLFDVRAALKILAPEREKEFAWLVRPNGRCAWGAFPTEPKNFPVFHPRTLLQHGREMMDTARIDLTLVGNMIAYRNGLIYAIAAATGLRLGTLVALRLGENIRRSETAWRLDVHGRDVKNGAPLDFALWHGLTDAIDHYVNEVRPALGAATTTTALWVIEGGAPLRYRGLEGTIRRLSRRLHAPGFGGHTFRRSAGTIGPLANPTNPAATAAMLGISKGVAQKHYNLGNAALAAEMFQEAMEEERQKC